MSSVKHRKINKDITDNEMFRNFVSQEFENVAANATIEELASFAFGDIERAIEAYKEYIKTTSKK
jgi:hypothetical protein